MYRKIDISHKTIFFITGWLVGLWLLFLIRDLLLILFVGLILVSALDPMVTLMEKIKFPRALGIAVSYIVIISALVGVLLIILPPLIEQSTHLVTALPPTLAQFFNIANIDRTLLQSELTSISRNLVSITLGIFDNLLTIIFVLVLTFYLLLERGNLEHRIAALFIGREERIHQLIRRIEDKLGAWLRGQLALSVIIGVLTYIGLIILNIPYALPLAMFAGIMEIVPVIGPIISAIPSVIIALTISPLLAAGVAAMYFVIQQLENHLVVPQVMQRAVGLNPLIVILAVAIGSRLLGVAGALLAVPIVVVLQIIIIELIRGKTINAENLEKN